MKKILLMAVMMLLQVTSLCAQESNFFIIQPMGGDKFGIEGGENGKSYMVTYKSDKKRKDLYNATINMMSDMGLVDKNTVKGKKVEEGVTEVIVPFYMNTGIGTRGGTAPLHLHGNMRFEFYDGGMKLKVENFEEEFFIVHYQPEMGKKGTDTYEKYVEFVQEANKAGGATTGLGKFIAKADKLQNLKISTKIGAGGVQSDAKQQIAARMNEANQERIKILDNYRSRVEEQEALFAKMQAAGEGEWYTLPSYMEAAEKCDYFVKYEKAKNATFVQYNNALKGHKLYALTDKRWAHDIRYIFDGIFITLAEEIGGSIEEITEDVSTTWERDGDLIVPTDPKKRAKFVKKGKSFLDYEAYE